MANGRTSAWRWIVLAGLGLVLVIPTLWVYVSLTARPLYPQPEGVRAIANSAPTPKWAGAVARAGQVARASVAEENLPGVSVAAGVGGELVWEAGFGVADVRTNVPVRPAHRFRIGTASTVLTSAAAGLLLEEGRLKLEDEIQKYVPAFPRKQWPLTIRSLMAHTSGLIPEGNTLVKAHCDQAAEALPYFAERPLAFEPDTQYRYSSYGWILVSAAMEAVTHKPLAKFLQERVFEPLGMRDTLPDPDVFEDDGDPPFFNLIRELIYDPRATRATGPESIRSPEGTRVSYYYPRFASDPRYGVHLMRPIDSSCYAGAGVFLATASDLVRFGMAIESGKVLKRDTVRLLQRPQRLVSGKETGQGLGWYTRTATLAGKQARLTGQDGRLLGGMVASLITVPEHGIVVAVLSNVPHGDTFSVAVKIAESFLER